MSILAAAWNALQPDNSNKGDCMACPCKFWHIVIHMNQINCVYFLHKACESGVQGGLLYEKVGDTCHIIWIKPLNETNLGVVQALFDA